MPFGRGVRGKFVSNMGVAILCLQSYLFGDLDFRGLLLDLVTKFILLLASCNFYGVSLHSIRTLYMPSLSPLSFRRSFIPTLQC